MQKSSSEALLKDRGPRKYDVGEGRGARRIEEAAAPTGAVEEPQVKEATAAEKPHFQLGSRDRDSEGDSLCDIHVPVVEEPQAEEAAPADLDCDNLVYPEDLIRAFDAFTDSRPQHSHRRERERCELLRVP